MRKAITEVKNIEEGLYCDLCGMPIRDENMKALYVQEKQSYFKTYFCTLDCLKYYYFAPEYMD